MTGHARTPPRSAPIESGADFAADVRYYLSQRPRQLPSRYLYDELGSALFDAICHLPWYPVTRAEMRLLAARGDAILAGADAPTHLVELGAGNGTKLAALITAAGVEAAPPTVHLVDVSRAALTTASRTLAAVAPVRIVTHEASYEDGLDQLRAAPTGERTLVLFLGSNIGNFDPDGARAFLRHVRSTLAAGDGLLLGADLVKPEAELLLAYDDPLGVTAAFNRNLLVRLNRELEADFDLASFSHHACWNAAPSRVEMHLVSTRAQRVRIRRAALEMTLLEGERIWTESSYEYSAAAVHGLLEACGFRVRAQWIDEASPFALTLAGC